MDPVAPGRHLVTRGRRPGALSSSARDEAGEDVSSEANWYPRFAELFDHGNKFLEAAETGNRRANVEQAIEFFTKSLRALPADAAPHYRVPTLGSLARAYSARVVGAPDSNAGKAIDVLREALAILPVDDPDAFAPELLGAFATAYMDRGGEDPASDVEEAIGYLEAGLRLPVDESSGGRAILQSNLGVAYTRRLTGEKADNLEQAIANLRAALEVFDRKASPSYWSDAQFNLGVAYLDRWRGGFAVNVERGIACLGGARDATPRDTQPRRWGLAEAKLGDAFWQRVDGTRTDNLRDAITHYHAALAALSRVDWPVEWARARYGLASAEADLAAATGESVGDPRIIDGFREAQSVLDEGHFPLEWAEIENAVALAYASLGTDTAELAEQSFKRALARLNALTAPRERHCTLRNLGDFYLGAGRWSEAERVYAEAISTGEEITQAAYTDVGRQEEAATASRVYAGAAYSLLRLGRRVDALVRLEEGKARLLAAALSLRDAELGLLPVASAVAIKDARERVRAVERELALPPGWPGRRRNDQLGGYAREARAALNAAIAAARAADPDALSGGTDVENIISLAATRALVFPLASISAGACFIVPPGASSASDIDEIRLQSLSTKTVAEFLRRWTTAYREARTNLLDAENRWRDEITVVLQRLWSTLMGPVDEKLREHGVEEATDIVLVPQGGLGLLPLHAASRVRAGEVRYFLDDWTVAYAPSAHSFAASLQDADALAETQASLVAAIDPTANLPFAELEGSRLEKRFKAAQVFLGEKATQEAVLTAAEHATHLHFACHGYYDEGDVLDSALMLAGDDPLQLREIATSAALPATRLAALSACETGITEWEVAPDEYVGLPSAFLEAGAATVLATLWAVNDLSTALLIDRFYLRHATEGAAPPAALRDAQRWLRHATAGELDLARLWKTLTNATASGGEADTNADLYAANPGLRPYEHPLYWAAFTCTGC